MDRRRFRILALIWLTALVGFNAAFPFLLYGVVKVSACERGGACGAVVVVGTVLKALGILIVGIALLVITWRRLRGLAISRLWFVATMLWFFGTAAFFIAVGNSRGANFGMGMISPGLPPVSLLFLLVFIGFLAVHPDGAQPTGGNLRVARLVAAGAAVHNLLLSPVPLLLAMTMVPIAGMGMNPLGVMGPVLLVVRVASFGLPFNMIPWLLLADLAIFAAALAYILIEQRRGSAPAAV